MLDPARLPAPDHPGWPALASRLRASLSNGLRDAVGDDPTGWPEALDLVAYVVEQSDHLGERYREVIARAEAMPSAATVNVALLGAWGMAALRLDLADLLVHAVAQDALDPWVPILLFYVDSDTDHDVSDLIARSIAKLDPSGEAITATIAASMMDTLGFTPAMLYQMAANIRAVASRKD